MNIRTALSASFVLTLVSCTAQTTEPTELRFAVISDLHVTLKADSHEIFDSAVVRITQAHPDVLLVTGDLTDRGDSTSHQYVARAFSEMEEGGTQVYVIPGNHDLYGKAASPADFARYYAGCGYDEAVLRHDASLSYMAYPRADVALLCLDSTRPMDDKRRHSDGGLSEATLQWAEMAAAQARQEGRRVVAMMHHQVMEHFDHQAELAANYVANTDSAYYPALSLVQQRLIAAGIRVMFTGHFHIQSIQQVTTDRGTMHDVSTGSLANYPSPIRAATLWPSDTLSITSDTLSIHRDHQLEHNREIARTFFSRGVNKVYPRLSRAEKKIPGPAKLLLRLPKSQEQMLEDVTERFMPVILDAYNTLALGDEEQRDPEVLYQACYTALDEYILYICRGNRMVARLLTERISKTMGQQTSGKNKAMGQQTSGKSKAMGQQTSGKNKEKDYLQLADAVLRSVLYNYRDTPANVISDSSISVSLDTKMDEQESQD